MLLIVKFYHLTLNNNNNNNNKICTGHVKTCGFQGGPGSSYRGNNFQKITRLSMCPPLVSLFKPGTNMAAIKLSTRNNADNEINITGFSSELLG